MLGILSTVGKSLVQSRIESLLFKIFSTAGDISRTLEDVQYCEEYSADVGNTVCSCKSVEYYEGNAVMWRLVLFRGNDIISIMWQ